jgi:hypothetical protein
MVYDESDIKMLKVRMVYSINIVGLMIWGKMNLDFIPYTHTKVHRYVNINTKVIS